MDCPCTERYCQAFADALGINIYFSWKEGGFEVELLREDTSTSLIIFEDDKKEIVNSREYREPIIINNWQYLSGAFCENCGAI